MNKLTFWEYFTSSFTNRLLTKNIWKTDQAVLLLLLQEQVSEAIFEDKSLWGSTVQWAHRPSCLCFHRQQLHALSRITPSKSSRAASVAAVVQLCSAAPCSSPNLSPTPHVLLVVDTHPHTLCTSYWTDTAEQGVLAQPWTDALTQTFLGSIPALRHLS